MLLVPVFNAIVIQRDRNRNMAYGELFWHLGFSVYSLTDSDLNHTYGVPADHLLIGPLNVTYEYPVLTLLFYAGLAAIEPGFYESSHMIVNFVMLLIVHLNLLIVLALGRDYWDRRWFQEIFLVYYGYQVAFSIAFAKIEPLSDLFLLIAIVYLREKHGIKAGVALALAAQVKIYPVVALPFLIASIPMSLVGFGVVSLIALVPYFMDGVVYTSLIEHVFNSPNYASMITNPYYVGFISENPLAVFGPLVLVITLLYGLTETRSWHGIMVPSLRLRTHNWKAILVYLAPISLMFFAWVMVWYHMWFLLLVFFLENEEDMSRYRWIIISLWVAYIVGIVCNLEYFLAEPLQYLLYNIRP